VDDTRATRLEARLSRLERDNRWWKLAAAMGGALALAALLGSTLPSAVAKGVEPAAPRAAGPGVVEAQRFVLRDASGLPRASLAVSDDGVPLLIFLDRDGEPRGVLGPKHLLLASDDGGSAVKLLVNPGGTPALRLEKDGRLRAVLGMTGDGTLALGFYGQDGKGRALLDVGIDGSPGLTLFTKTGKVAWSAP
jgi:hypothetical protein